MIDPDIESLRLPLATKTRMQRDRARQQAADHARRFGITRRGVSEGGVLRGGTPSLRGRYRGHSTFRSLLDAGVPVIDIAKWHGVTIEDVEAEVMQ